MKETNLLIVVYIFILVCFYLTLGCFQEEKQPVITKPVYKKPYTPYCEKSEEEKKVVLDSLNQNKNE